MPETLTTTTTTTVRHELICDKCGAQNTEITTTTDGVRTFLPGNGRRYDTYNGNVRCLACNALALMDSYKGRIYTRSSSIFKAIGYVKLHITDGVITWDEQGINPITTVFTVEFTSSDGKIDTKTLSNFELFRHHIGKAASAGWVLSD